MVTRVPLEDLLDLEALGEHGRPPTPRRIREALPSGWVPDDDGTHARRDFRLFFRDAWVMILGLVCFGAAGVGLFIQSFPRGTQGLFYGAGLLVALVLIGGVVAPMVTRALQRKA